ncbi:MAG: MazG nucleotide pyrophosphohydrolase domain-containing protein [bacterium]
MNLPQLQKDVHEVAMKFKFNWSNYVQYVHLVEEVAELGEALTVHLGDRKSGSGESALADHADLQEEFGDVLFTVCELANQLDIDLVAAMNYTFKRYQGKLEKLAALQNDHQG